MQLQNQQQVNINPDDLHDITCKKCDSKNFTQVYQMKKLSALMSPTGQEQIVTLPVFICNDCKEELSELKPE